MNNTSDKAEAWQEILEFWFPEGNNLQIDLDTHRDYWLWRMRGGADQDIIHRFSDLTAGAAAGEFDSWASDPDGRLALIIILDQFSRSVWRDSAQAYAQDPAALAFTMEGLSNGHYAALSTPWHKLVFGLPLGHCEGNDHPERVNLLIRLREDIAEQAPSQLVPIYQSFIRQAHDVRQVITAFGRHPHRNETLGRSSTPDEDSYISTKQFPHLRVLQGLSR